MHLQVDLSGCKNVTVFLAPSVVSPSVFLFLFFKPLLLSDSQILHVVLVSV